MYNLGWEIWIWTTYLKLHVYQYLWTAIKYSEQVQQIHKDVYIYIISYNIYLYIYIYTYTYIYIYILITILYNSNMLLAQNCLRWSLEPGGRMAPIGSPCESGQATLLWRRTCTKVLRRRSVAPSLEFRLSTSCWRGATEMCCFFLLWFMFVFLWEVQQRAQARSNGQFMTVLTWRDKQPADPVMPKSQGKSWKWLGQT
jgi:hypothetical protein